MAELTQVRRGRPSHHDTAGQPVRRRLKWTEAMSVGVPELDADHRGLIKVINELLRSADAAEPDMVLRQCLYALLRYAEFHFGREEAVQAACEFPALSHHKDEHRAFTARIRGLVRQLDEGDLPATEIVNSELYDFLKDWWNHHILIEDMAYRSHAEFHAAARRAAKTFRASEIWWSD